MKKELNSVIIFLMDQALKSSRRYAQREFEQRGINITIDQWVLLKIIEENEGLAQNELAKRSYRDGASITRSLNLLEKREFIARQEINGNKRQYKIVLTTSGKQFIRQHMGLVKEMRAKSLDGLKDGEILELKRMLEIIRDNME